MLGDVMDSFTYTAWFIALLVGEAIGLFIGMCVILNYLSGYRSEGDTWRPMCYALGIFAGGALLLDLLYWQAVTGKLG